MKRIVEGVVIAVVVLGGAWLAMVTTWLGKFDPTRRYE